MHYSALRGKSLLTTDDGSTETKWPDVTSYPQAKNGSYLSENCCNFNSFRCFVNRINKWEKSGKGHVGRRQETEVTEGGDSAYTHWAVNREWLFAHYRSNAIITITVTLYEVETRLT